VAAGTAKEAIVAAPPQREDMQTDLARMGIRKPTAQPQAQQQPSHYQPGSPVPPRPAASAPSAPPAATYTPPPAQPAPPQNPQPTEQPQPYKPEQPFQRGVNRPGVSRFISGTRRR
jgi:hypothetical protein